MQNRDPTSSLCNLELCILFGPFFCFHTHFFSLDILVNFGFSLFNWILNVHLDHLKLSFLFLCTYISLILFVLLTFCAGIWHYEREEMVHTWEISTGICVKMTACGKTKITCPSAEWLSGGIDNEGDSKRYHKRSGKPQYFSPCWPSV